MRENHNYSACTSKNCRVSFHQIDYYLLLAFSVWRNASWSRMRYRACVDRRYKLISSRENEEKTTEEERVTK